MFDEVIARASNLAGPEFTKGKIIIEASELEPIIIPLKPYKELNGKLVLDTIGGVLSSHQEIQLDAGHLNVSIGTISIPSGAGKHYTGQESAFSKHSISHILNNSVTCLAQAIAIGIAKNSIVSNDEIKVIRNQREGNKDILIRTGKCSRRHYERIRDSNCNEIYKTY